MLLQPLTTWSIQFSSIVSFSTSSNKLFPYFRHNSTQTSQCTVTSLLMTFQHLIPLLVNHQPFIDFDMEQQASTCVECIIMMFTEQNWPWADMRSSLPYQNKSTMKNVHLYFQHFTLLLPIRNSLSTFYKAYKTSSIRSSYLSFPHLSLSF